MRSAIAPDVTPLPQRPGVGYPRAPEWAALTLSGPWQRSLRHDVEPRDWRAWGLGVGVAIALTLLAMFAFNQGMQRQPRLDNYRGTIQVNLIDPTPPVDVPEPPPPEPAPFQQRQSRVRIETPKMRSTPPPAPAREQPSTEMTGRLGSAGAPALFGADGRVRLPSTSSGGVPATAATTEQQRARQNWEQLQKRGQNPLDCERTRFAQAFRQDQSVGDAVAGKYLKWIGLSNQAAIAKRAADREQRAADGCDPPK